MAQVKCAVCNKTESSSNMKYCNKCNLWVHYSCAGGTSFFHDAKCPSCGKKLG